MLITGIKENPPFHWLCCVEYSGLRTYIYTFLVSFFKDSDRYKKYVRKKYIITDKDVPNKTCKYQIIYKMDENSSRMILLLIDPKPCYNNPCMYIKKY